MIEKEGGGCYSSLAEADWDHNQEGGEGREPLFDLGKNLMHTKEG